MKINFMVSRYFVLIRLQVKEPQTDFLFFNWNFLTLTKSICRNFDNVALMAIARSRFAGR